jgi:hypothetical protein
MGRENEWGNFKGVVIGLAIFISLDWRIIKCVQVGCMRVMMIRMDSYVLILKKLNFKNLI